MRISPEEVAYWYFRLNGFLTIPNFIVHPDEPGNQSTDIDLLGIRFPYREELMGDPMEDDEIFSRVNDKPHLVIAEAKKGRCNINNALNAENLHRVLRAVGIVPLNRANEIANLVFEHGQYSSEQFQVSLFCLGSSSDPNIEGGRPGLVWVQWDHILSFMFRRFERYRSRKADHTQWDDVGKFLWSAAALNRDAERFINFIKTSWDVNEAAYKHRQP